MNRPILPALLAVLSVASLAAGCGSSPPKAGASSSSSSGSGSGGGGGGTQDVLSFYWPPPDSCAYECATLATCGEQTTPYACPSVGAWDKVPHGDACGGWDAKYPDVKAGKCTATAPQGEALRHSGPDADHKGTFVLPDGRRIRPAGKEWILADVHGGLTSNVIDVPGTPFVLTVETGAGEHAVRSVDVTKLAAGTDPIASTLKFELPDTLNSGMAFTPPGRVFVSSHDGVVHALTLDPVTGALARDDMASIQLPQKDTYLSGIAVSPDGKMLVASAVYDQALLVFSIAAGPTYGALLGQVSLGSSETFGAYFDPHDPTGSVAYVSLWKAKQVVAVDLAKPAAPTVKATYTVEKNPEGLAFVNARFMVVANANGDSLSIVDRVSGEVTRVPIEAGAGALHGEEPSVLAFDEGKSRLYAALGGENAVAAFDVDLSKTPPALAPVGRLGGAWWPSGVVVRSDGTGDLVVTNLRGHGGGPIPQPFGFGDSDIGQRMHGSVQWIGAPSGADLVTGDKQVSVDNAVGVLGGAPAVACPAGADDFPLPSSNQGASKTIDHVFFIMRENKNFDALLGDMAGVDGEPTYTLKSSSKDMDAIWHNLRTAGRAFTISDNYYTDAVFSTQGHVWATYARSSDFNERTWALSGSRDNSPRALPGGGVSEVGRPLEGSLFDWLRNNKVRFDILGEIDGLPVTPPGEPSPLDFHYPGIGQAITSIDLPKACYAAGRVRVACDVGNFVFQTLPNDHTVGVSASNATPAVMCAVNDEATGIMLDAISHSPFWKSSIVIITEDDPSSGGEHVDGHRTPLVIVSPWVKRGYVSKTHIDMASIHKMYAHIFGLPYPNRQVAEAMVPYDLFTSTPDYTPFTYTPRTWPLGCGMATAGDPAPGSAGAAGGVPGAEEELTALWDFAEEDRQPGLGEQVWRSMRGRPIQELTPAMRARIGVTQRSAEPSPELQVSPR